MSSWQSLRFMGLALVTCAFAVGLFLAGSWVHSGAKWQQHLARAESVGRSVYGHFQDGTALPEGVRTGRLSEQDQRLALQGNFARIIGAPRPARLTLVPLLADAANPNSSAFNLVVVSPDLVYSLADISIRDGQTAAETTGAIFRQISSYCSDPLILAKMGDQPWVIIEGKDIWGCAAAPPDRRLLVALISLVCLAALATIALNTSGDFSRFSEMLRSRRRIGGPDSYVVEGPSELQEIVDAVNGYLQAEREQLENRAVVLSGVSHDLGTPATRLRLRAALIADKELRTKLEADIDSMTEMIDSVLTYTRAEMNIEKPRKLSLTSLIEAIVSDYQDTGRPVTLMRPRDTVVYGGRSVFMSKAGQSVVSGGREVIIFGRPVSLQRAVSNLIDNALKYGRRATVELQTTATEVSIVVTDDGSETSVGEIETLLAPFRRGDNTTAIDGFGLGLTIVSTIAAMHGGALSFEEAAPGLRARVTIPRS